jgi:hypothetical protein
VENDRIQAAQGLLRTHLEDLIERASDEYNHDIWHRVNPLAEADLTRQMIQEWRDKSIERVSDSFERFFHAAVESPGVGERVSRASELSWQVINAVFGWESGDHSNCRVFAKCLFDDPTMTGELSLPRNPAGVPWESIAEAINYDFWTRFDRLLKQLANDKISATPPPLSATREPGSSEEPVKVAPQTMGSQYTMKTLILLPLTKRHAASPERRWSRRSSRSWTRLGPIISRRTTSRIWPNAIASSSPLKRAPSKSNSANPSPLFSCTGNTGLLAIKIAAVKIGKKEATIEDNWRRYGKFVRINPHKDGQPAS